MFKGWFATSYDTIKGTHSSGVECVLRAKAALVQYSRVAVTTFSRCLLLVWNSWQAEGPFLLVIGYY